MKINLEISDDNESTDAPYWLILDPQQMMKPDIDRLAGMITGPFFSREEAETHLKNRKHAYSKRAMVFCLSGYYAEQYRSAWREQHSAKFKFVSGSRPSSLS